MLLKSEEFGGDRMMETFTRKEAEHLAQYKGVDFTPGQAKILTVRALKQAGVSNVVSPLFRGLGVPRHPTPPYEKWVALFTGEKAPDEMPKVEQTLEEVDATDLMIKEFEKERDDFSAMPFWQLKQECKARGIAFKRTDKKVDLLGKLNGKDSS